MTRRDGLQAGDQGLPGHAIGAALLDAMSVGEAPGGLAAADAAARWSAIQRRADDLAQTLDILPEAVPQDSADMTARERPLSFA